MNKGKKLIIAALCGLPADNKIVKSALGDAQAGRDMLSTAQISKEDILGTLEGDDSFFAYPEAFDHLSAIAEMLEEQGDPLTAADFTRKIGNNMSLIKYAEQHKKADALFAPQIWKGRLESMDHVFFTVSKTVRDAMNYKQLRRSVAAMTGEMVPEDRLSACGMDAMSVRLKIRHGKVDELKAELDKHNEPMRKEYMFLLDSAGDSVFEHSDAFDNLEKWIPVLAEQGETLTKDDFTYHVGDRLSPLAHAVKLNKLARVFHANIWQKRAGEMMELFKELPEAEQKKVDILHALSAIKENEYGDKVITDENVTLDTLTRVLNADEKGQDHFYPVHALGFARVWENMAAIRERLAARNEKLTLDHLRQPAGLAGDNVMVLAARSGHFDQVMAIAAESGQTVGIEELTTPSSSGKSILEVLVGRGEAETMFRPDNWIGRGREMVQLWHQIPEDKRDDIDFEAAYGRVTMLTLRNRFAAGQPKPSM